MKKSVIIFSAILSVILIAGLVAAQNLPAPPVTMAQLKTGISTILSSSNNAVFGQADDLAARLLFFLLLLIVLYKPSEKIIGEERSNIALALSAIISIIAIRFLNTDIVSGLFLPTAALGVTLSILLPIALFGAFLTTSDLPKTIRKSAWWIFAVIFISLWWIRGTSLGDLSWMYAAAALVCLAGAFFDGTLHAWWYQARSEKAQIVSRGVASEVALQRLEKLYELLATASEKNKPAILKEIKRIEGNLKDVNSA